MISTERVKQIHHDLRQAAAKAVATNAEMISLCNEVLEIRMFEAEAQRLTKQGIETAIKAINQTNIPLLGRVQ